MLEMLLMNHDHPTRRQMMDIVRVLGIDDDVWNDDLELILKRVHNLNNAAHKSRGKARETQADAQ